MTSVDCAIRQWGASANSPLCIDIAVLTVQTALEAGLRPVVVSSDAGTDNYSDEPVPFTHSTEKGSWWGETDLRLGPLHVIITVDEKVTLDFDGQNDFPLYGAIAIRALQAAREAGLRGSGGISAVDANSPNLEGVVNPVDIRLGPLHVIILRREDDSDIEN